jgi:hypothetical protein
LIVCDLRFQPRWSLSQSKTKKGHTKLLIHNAYANTRGLGRLSHGWESFRFMRVFFFRYAYVRPSEQGMWALAENRNVKSLRLAPCDPKMILTVQGGFDEKGTDFHFWTLNSRLNSGKAFWTKSERHLGILALSLPQEIVTEPSKEQTPTMRQVMTPNPLSNLNTNDSMTSDTSEEKEEEEPRPKRLRQDGPKEPAWMRNQRRDASRLRKTLKQTKLTQRCFN